MICYYPAYYRDFRCLAGACPDSCCRLWDIDVDPETVERYRSVPGDYGRLLRNALRTSEEGTVIAQKDGKCPLWREDGLCSVQTELGHNALCRVCREFPRISHDYGTFMEYGLELSCPEAARLILSGMPGEMAGETVPGGTVPDYDANAMSVLLSSRKQMRALAADPDWSVPRVMCAMLFYGSAVQETLYGGEPPVLNPAAAWENTAAAAAEASMREIAEFYKGLEILTPAWEERLERIGETPVLHDGIRPLITYFVDRYWLQAVSDLDVLGRVKFILVSCLLIGALEGSLGENACLYSKEIESDPENMEAILDACYDSPALTDRKLLYLLRKAEKKP